MTETETYTTEIRIDADQALRDVDALVQLLNAQKAALVAQAEAQARARGEVALATFRQREAIKATREALALARAEQASLKEQERAAAALAEARRKAEAQSVRDADKAARERERIAERERRALAQAQQHAAREQARAARAAERQQAEAQREQLRAQAEQQRHAEAQQTRRSELTAESFGALAEILGDPVDPFGMLVSGATALAGIVAGQLARGVALYQERSEAAEAATATWSRGLDNLAVSVVAVADAQTDLSTKAAGAGLGMDLLAERVEAVGSQLHLTRDAGEAFATHLFGSFAPAVIAGVDTLDRLGAVALRVRSDTEELASTVTTLAVGFGAVADGATLASEALDTWGARLDAIESKWDEALDNGLAGVIGGAAGGALQRGRGGAGPSGPSPEVKRAYEELLNSIKGQNDELERAAQLEQTRLRTLRQTEVREANRLTEIGERNAERVKAARAARSGASSGLTPAQSAELERFTARQKQVADALNRSTEAAAGLGVEMAALTLQTAIAGQGFGSFGAQAAQMFGTFASQAGQVLIATALGEIAIFSGNPFAALAAGLALTGIGAVIGGIGQRALKRAPTSTGSAASALGSSALTPRSTGDRGSERGPDTVVVYFGTERLEGAVTRSVRSAQRNGRLPAFGRVS